MATVITSECINCGACEPECPNTAIYQGGVEWEFGGEKHGALREDIFYIVPEKCTECVGFYDREACAAVCPVDCCIPDPERPESEEVLLARARELHPEREFGADFPSRFKKEGAEAKPPEAAEAAPSAPVQEKPQPAAAPPPPPKPKPEPAPAAAAAAPKAAPAPPAAKPAGIETSVTIPDLEEWEVPIACFHCEGEYAVAFKHFRPGVVLRCPHCTGSFVATSTIYKNVAAALRDFNEGWRRAFEDFQERRRSELLAFEEGRRRELEEFNETLKTVNAGVNPPGKQRRRLSLFGFQRVG